MHLLPLNLIRYLFVCKVNSTLVWLPSFPSIDLSLVLATIIADRLPTVQARPWHKALTSWGRNATSRIGKKRLERVPDVFWPIEAVLFPYPGKRTYGQGELILWELKLMGRSADHGLFLEVIMPAMEELGGLVAQWQPPNCLWGRFDIHSVCVARGPNWEPLVRDGKLDLRYKATPLQWSEGLTFGFHSRCVLDRLTWITPFDLVKDENRSSQQGKNRTSSCDVPSLRYMLDALMIRMSPLVLGKHNNPEDLWGLLGIENQLSFQDTMELSSHIPILHKELDSVPWHWPGRLIGTQTFATSIPDSIMPYLGLASMFHIGRHTHFGCGTFRIS